MNSLRSLAVTAAITAGLGAAAVGIKSAEFDPHYYLGGTPRLSITSRFGVGMIVSGEALYKTANRGCRWVGNTKDEPDGGVDYEINRFVRSTSVTKIVSFSGGASEDGMTHYIPCR